MQVVVPPKAAARVPVSKSSAEMVPPKGSEKCVCASTPPGKMSSPCASTVAFAAGRDARSDRYNATMFDAQVGAVAIHRGDDGAVHDSEAHARSSLGSKWTHRDRVLGF